jgi:hypothetical protein
MVPKVMKLTTGIDFPFADPLKSTDDENLQISQVASSRFSAPALPIIKVFFAASHWVWSGRSAEPTEFRDTLINSPVPSNKIL